MPNRYPISSGSYGETRDDIATHYQIHIMVPDRGIEIHAFMPENFTSAINSEYEMPFAESSVTNLLSKFAGVAGEAVGAAAKLTGFGTTVQQASMQVWQGVAPMEFSIPVRFLYNTDTERDIIAPMKALMSLALPYLAYGELADNRFGGQSGSTMRSPGPKVVPGNLLGENFFDWVSIENQIQLMIGSFLFFDSVVVTGVDSEYEIKLDRENKKPISLEATVNFTTFLTPVVDELDRIFLSGGVSGP